MRVIALNRSHRQSGMTLIELVTTIVILSVALIGVTAAVSSAISRTSDVMVETRAVALAQSYLDEILGKRFDEHSAPRGIPPCRSTCSEVLGPDGTSPNEEERPDFDDVDDYHGVDEGDDPLNPLQDADGNERLDYDNYRVTVNVRYLEPCGIEADWFNFGLEICEPADLTEEQAAEPILAEASRRAKLITVRVRHRQNDDGWPFSAYKVNF